MPSSRAKDRLVGSNRCWVEWWSLRRSREVKMWVWEAKSPSDTRLWMQTQRQNLNTPNGLCLLQRNLAKTRIPQIKSKLTSKEILVLKEVPLLEPTPWPTKTTCPQAWLHPRKDTLTLPAWLETKCTFSQASPKRRAIYKLCTPQLFIWTKASLKHFLDGTK